MFFLSSSFRYCPPLKNDGRGEMRFREAVNDFLPKKKRIRTESRTRLREASMGKAEEQKIDVSQSERKKWLWQKSCPRLSGSKRTTFRGAERRCKSVWDALPLAKVSAELTKGARNIRIVSYKTTVNTCLSFLNEVMASEPLFEEQSDAVKVSETLSRPTGAVRIRQRTQDLNILTCVRTLAPIASRGSALPSAFGGSEH